MLRQLIFLNERSRSLGPEQVLISMFETTLGPATHVALSATLGHGFSILKKTERDLPRN
jgi:hypothetical protein